jgi:hypothetical protein
MFAFGLESSQHGLTIYRFEVGFRRRTLLQKKLARLLEIGESLFHGLALRGRTRLRVERDVASFPSRNQKRMQPHAENLP